MFEHASHSVRRNGIKTACRSIACALLCADRASEKFADMNAVISNLEFERDALESRNNELISQVELEQEHVGVLEVEAKKLKRKHEADHDDW